MRVDKSKWQKKTIGQIGKVISGSTPRTDNPSNWEGGTYNWVTPAELKGDKYYGSTIKKITDTALESTNLTLMPIGTVLLSSRAPIGKVAITTEPMYCNQGFKNIECNSSIHNEFLYYYLRYNNDELNRRGNGVTFKEISKKIVEQFPVIVPSIEEQKGIASELDAIQTMIDGYKAQITDLDELANSIFLETFGDPITNDKGWKKTKICEEATVIGGATPRTDNPLNWDCGSLNWVTPAELKGERYYGQTVKQITEYAVKNANLTLLPIGTVLLSSRAPIGKVAITTEPMYCNQGFKNIICGKNLVNEYLYQYLLFNNDELNRRGSGVTFKEISKKVVENFPIILPPIELQQQYADNIEAIEKQKALLREQLADAEQLMAERMQYYFS